MLMRCLWTDVHVLKLFHSAHQCMSGPRHAESQARDVAAAALVGAENLPEIWGRHHLFQCLCDLVLHESRAESLP